MEILTKEEAELLPAGKGREDPNMNPFLSPPELVLANQQVS